MLIWSAGIAFRSRFADIRRVLHPLPWCVGRVFVLFVQKLRGCLVFVWWDLWGGKEELCRRTIAADLYEL